MLTPKQLICFDLNQTLIQENSWLNLNLAMGMTLEEDQALFSLYQQKKLSYQDWQRQLAERYIKSGKASKEKILAVVLQYQYLTGAREIVSYFQQNGFEVILISGAMDLLIEHIAQELKITHWAAANRLHFDKNDYLQEIQTIAGSEAEIKLKLLQGICEDLHFPLEKCICIGDGENDLEMFRATGRGITFPGSKLESEAWQVIGKLSELRIVIG
ncbi:MAG: HAD-IB family phosphatase [bacterium]